MKYRVEVSDLAEAEAHAAFLWYSQRSPKHAGKWYDDLLNAISSLSEMPERCPVVTEGSKDRTEVRLMLYGKKPSVYRILFTIFHHPNGEGEVRILHVRHASRSRAE